MSQKPEQELPTRRPTKRARTTTGILGAPSHYDDSDATSVQTPTSVPSSSASSTRPQRVTTVPPLTTLCIRIFALHFVRLYKPGSSSYLELLPDALLERAFAALRAQCPRFLSHEIIVSFLRTPSVVLDSSLTGVNKHTIQAVPRFNANVTSLEISGFDKLSDETFASVFPKLSRLKALILRGCSKVSTKTAAALANHCKELRTLNLNYTSVSPISVAPIFSTCTELEVLKLAGINNWTDATFAKLLLHLGDNSTKPTLKTLKLRQTLLSETSFRTLLPMLPNLERLDISFTAVKHLAFNAIAPLKKLSLTSTNVNIHDLLHSLAHLPQLQKLALGAIGLSLTDKNLTQLTDVLESTCPELESVNLVGNGKLGNTSTRNSSALKDFVTRVGRRCRWLNLSSLPYLRSTDLIGLMPDQSEDSDVSSLSTVLLNNTRIDDDAAPFLASCTNLTSLEVSGTKLTEEGLFLILDSCEHLVELNLTSCRGVSVGDRRRFFEVWEEQRSV